MSMMRCQLQGEVGRLVKLSASKQLFPKLLEACSTNRSLKENKRIHALTITLAPIPMQSAFVLNNLIICYLSFGDVFLARKVCLGGIVAWMKRFEHLKHMPQKSLVTWNSMVSLLARYGFVEDCIIFRDFIRTGATLSECSFLGISPRLDDLEYGEQVIRNGFESDVIVGTALVDFYAKCDKLVEAHRCFDYIEGKNVASRNALILGYSKVCAST
ncbi:hypothetical protein L6164_018629 [Bauhinia variegata]|uniref:Uncharacterized protein n=1 Tax=Bauhinia variegata TaxID=167791 RepID=A0ACB9NDU1_BAUVA|nr:hypothetical protein L6164_018629 [Bauhinia variegata]